jgi:glycosyltransferase involved in cell wall biosynthesis
LPDSVEEWIIKLSILIDNIDIRIKMGENGRKVVENKYSFHANYPILEENLMKILSLKG